MGSNEHIPVLLGPVLEGLDIKKDGLYVDGTFGRGGHSEEILKRLNSKGRLIGIDRDPDAIASAPTTLVNDPRFELIRGESGNLKKYIEERNLQGEVDGLLFDLGVSSPQLDEAKRGFSFLRDGPLDMRMDPSSGIPASELISNMEKAELKKIFRKFGEETYASRVAQAICDVRKTSKIETTLQLAKIIDTAIPSSKKPRKRHPATKVFQAIRIFINDELTQLQRLLLQSIEVLKKDGRLCVISFHSLEDRIVKRFMRDMSREHEQYRGMPNIPTEFQPKLTTIKTLIKAPIEEINKNIRSRSARLRVGKRI